MTFQEKLGAFIARLNKEAVNFAPDVWGYDKGRKYFRVFLDHGNQKMSRYFVRVEDGAIFASESWRKPNLKRQYGTLDTLDSFDWSGYNAVAKPGSAFIMKNTAGGYQTAVPA